MNDRVIEIADKYGELHVKNEQLVIEWPDYSKDSIPLCDIAVLIISNPRVGISQSVLSGLVAHGGTYICCDQHHLPVGLLLPIANNTLHAKKLSSQIECPKPRSKRLWQQIVKEKIKAQGRLLMEMTGSDNALFEIAKKVLSGDSNNREAVASKRYWKALLGESFRRNRETKDENQMLNYGYAVLRAIVARAICASGLHPSIGIHHHNQYNQFALADDLMEPLRPMVDRVVAGWKAKGFPVDKLNRDARAALLEVSMSRVNFKGEDRTLFDAVLKMAQSLASAFADADKQLRIPEI